MEQQIILEADQEIKVPPLKEFREFIDNHKWQKKHEEIFIKFVYLIGARGSEVVTKVTPYMLQHNMTQAYGKLLRVGFTSFRTFDERKLQILLVQSGIAKRNKNSTESIEECRKETEEIAKARKEPETTAEQQLIKKKVKMKVVPIILSPNIEPWGIDLANWIQAKNRSPCAFQFPWTEGTCQNIVRRNLSHFDPCFEKPKRMHCHALRHFRITSLIQDYQFSPYQVSNFVGWSLTNTSRRMGIQSSSNLDTYSHLLWTDYIEKLAIPLNQVL
jgi:hypothetical protein